MNNTFYPEFDAEYLFPLKLVFQGLASDPLWLERRECPYDDHTKRTLAGMWSEFKSTKRPVEVPSIDIDVAEVGDEKWDMLSNELVLMFKELRAFAKMPSDKEEDVKDAMAAYRTSTALLEKLVALGERIANVKNVSDFQAKVMAVFDEVLTPDQRTRAIAKLTS